MKEQGKFISFDKSLLVSLKYLSFFFLLWFCFVLNKSCSTEGVIVRPLGWDSQNLDSLSKLGTVLWS